MKSVFAAAVLAASLTAVNAHGTVSGFLVNGQSSTDNVRPIGSVEPVTSVSDAKMKCGNGDSAASGVAQAKPGDDIGFTMKNGEGGVWVHYMGPVSYYMYQCDGDAASCDPSGANWVAVAHNGDDGTNNWYMKHFTESQPVGFKMPNVPNGDYIVRQELAAIHNGLEFYIQCANVKVTGSTDGKLTGDLVSFPGAYTGEEPGFHFNPYGANLTTYSMPGPAVYAGGSAPAPAPAPPAEPAPAPAPAPTAAPGPAPAPAPTSCKARRSNSRFFRA